ncbi:MAG: AmmeMemoRadiSam system radical SAM enzyme [Patescibacteria group bacterium]|nr:AmmeMemoRadiSam system radical SAM enzyme [Patescibacteria group bacterium]
MKECLIYKKQKDGSVVCGVCNHFCRIKPERVGICGVRKNLDGRLFLLVYGKSAALNIDPIEKKPLFHFLPGSQVYSFGTLGCNFSCKNCQNYDISQIFGKKGKLDDCQSMDWGLKAGPDKIVYDAGRFGCKSVAATYNEPAVFFEYALEVMAAASKKGLKNVWVSNGYFSKEVLERVAPDLDAINVDLKSMEDDFYKKICGARLEPVLENLRRIVRAGIWLEITTLVIPDYSDDMKMLNKLACFISRELGRDVPWHVSAFSGAISWKMKQVRDTGAEKIEQVVKLGRKAGLKYVYGGNVSAAGLEDTRCHKCGRLVIKRQGYRIESSLKGGKCPDCGEKIAGVWK